MSGMPRKQNFEKVSMPPRPLPFAFSPPRFFRFSFLSVGKGFAKSPRLVKFFGRNCEWVVGQDFHWNFLVKVTWFFAFFSGLFD